MFCEIVQTESAQLYYSLHCSIQYIEVACFLKLVLNQDNTSILHFVECSLYYIYRLMKCNF